MVFTQFATSQADQTAAYEFTVVLNALKSEISEFPVVLNTALVSAKGGREQQTVRLSRSLPTLFFLSSEETDLMAKL